MQIVMIINPSSGLQGSMEDLNYIYSELTKHHTAVRYYTEKQYDAKNLAIEAIKDEKDLIIVCGGDGTVSEIADAVGILKKSIPVAIYPSGTSNDYAVNFKISTDPDKFLDMVKTWDIRQVDVGQMNDHYFINVAAIGEITQVADSTDKDLKARLGRLAYILYALPRLFYYLNNTSLLEINTDSQTHRVNSIVGLVSNTRRVGGFNRICPDAVADDGLLDVFVLRKANIFSLALSFVKILLGRHCKDRNVLYFQTESLTIDSKDREVPINIDGEEMGRMPLEIKVHKGLLKLLVSS